MGIFGAGVFLVYLISFILSSVFFFFFRIIFQLLFEYVHSLGSGSQKQTLR